MKGPVIPFRTRSIDRIFFAGATIGSLDPHGPPSSSSSPPLIVRIRLSLPRAVGMANLARGILSTRWLLIDFPSSSRPIIVFISADPRAADKIMITTADLAVILRVVVVLRRGVYPFSTIFEITM